MYTEVTATYEEACSRYGLRKHSQGSWLECIRRQPTLGQTVYDKQSIEASCDKAQSSPLDGLPLHLHIVAIHQPSRGCEGYLSHCMVHTKAPVPSNRSSEKCGGAYTLFGPIWSVARHPAMEHPSGPPPDNGRPPAGKPNPHPARRN